MKHISFNNIVGISKIDDAKNIHPSLSSLLGMPSTYSVILSAAISSPFIDGVMLSRLERERERLVVGALVVEAVVSQQGGIEVSGTEVADH